MIGLCKAEVVRAGGPWRGREDLELATLEWVDWFHHRRLYSTLDYLPPGEYEATCYPVSLLAGTGTQ